MLAKSNLPVKVVQTMARHSDPKMTLNVYSHLTVHDTSTALDALPDLSKRPDEPKRIKATGTDPSPIKVPLAHYLPTGGDGAGRLLTDVGGMAPLTSSMALGPKPPESEELDASGRVLTETVASDRGGARTLDQRINVPHRLSPTTGNRPFGRAVRVLKVWTIPSPSQACRV
jgi:hypothetical protein